MGHDYKSTQLTECTVLSKTLRYGSTFGYLTFLITDYMENSIGNHHGEFELEDVFPSCGQKLPRPASDSSSLHSTANSNEDPCEHVEANRIESFEIFTADEEKAVVRKLDLHLVLFIAFLYMLSFLDRSSESKRTHKKVRVLCYVTLY